MEDPVNGDLTFDEPLLIHLEIEPITEGFIEMI